MPKKEDSDLPAYQVAIFDASNSIEADELRSFKDHSKDLNLVFPKNLGEVNHLISKDLLDLLVFVSDAIEGDTVEFVSKLNRNFPALMLIAVLPKNSDELGLEMIKLGVSDYLCKPVDVKLLLLAIRKKIVNLNPVMASRSRRFKGMIGGSQVMQEVFSTIARVSAFDTTVLISGESGTGKELVAKAIHENSSRATGSFVAVNCGAIPSQLVESELFGHVKGAFTDASQDKAGFFELASGGTIFLDEIAELPMSAQVKLLRVLQERVVQPVGSAETRPISIRVVTATLKNLESLVAAGKFREDLFYRLHVVQISLPPLRARGDDLIEIAEHFLSIYSKKMHIRKPELANEVVTALRAFNWPGNIRQLENCIEHALVFSKGKVITLECLPGEITADSESFEDYYKFKEHADSLSVKLHQRVMEESLIRKALIMTNGNRTHASRLLEMSHRSLLYKIKEFGLDDFGKSK